MANTHDIPRMQHKPGILFAEDFDDEPLLSALSHSDCEVPCPDIIEPTFTVDDMNAARQQAFMEGRNAALTDLAEQRRIATDRALNQLQAMLSQIRDEAVTHNENTASVIARLIFGTLASLLPHMCARHDAAEIAWLVRDVIVTLKPEQALCITVAPGIVDDIRASLESLSPEASRRIAIATQSDLEQGDVRLTWDTGCASRSSGSVQKSITEILERLGLLDPVKPMPDLPVRPSMRQQPHSSLIDTLTRKVEREDA